MYGERGIPSNAKKDKIIIGTVIMIGIAFIILIGLFIMFTQYLPQLTGKCVAVVDVNMPLTVEGSPTTIMSTGYPSSGELANSIKELNDREDVGAVLFVFNSGGGSVVATHEIYNEVKELKKPKVSYFREVAASGAYYVASGTDYIVSDPDALTGSIGVVTTVMSMSGLMEKLGINITSVVSGTHKDIGSSYREMSKEEYAILKGIVDEIFDEFKTVIIENRGSKLNMGKFNETTDGRILTGRQALEVGLVDELGDKNDALMKAAQMAGIEAEKPEDVRICYVTVPTQEGGLFGMDSLINSINEKIQPASLRFQ